MKLNEAKRIMQLIANGPDDDGRAWENQKQAAQAILKELDRLEGENIKLRQQLTGGKTL